MEGVGILSGEIDDVEEDRMAWPSGLALQTAFRAAAFFGARFRDQQLRMIVLRTADLEITTLNSSCAHEAISSSLAVGRSAR